MPKIRIRSNAQIRARMEKWEDSSLPPETRTFLQHKAEEVLRLLKNSAENIYQIGEILSQVKDQLPHGTYRKWAQSTIGLHPRAVSRFVRVYNTFKHCPHLIGEFSISALYAVTTTSTSKEMLLEVMQMASAGSKVTHKLVKSLLLQYKEFSSAQDDTLMEYQNSKEIDQFDLSCEAQLQILEPNVPIQNSETLNESFHGTEEAETTSESNTIEAGTMNAKDTREIRPTPKEICNMLAPHYGEHVATQVKAALIRAVSFQYKKSCASVEWYTPIELIQLVTSMFGTIDVDPATCEYAQQNIKAATYYTEKENGLLYPWKGRVFLNPPFNRQGPSVWVSKFLQEFMNGTMTEGVMLVYAATDSKWFQPLWNFCLCFVSKHLQFYREPQREGDRDCEEEAEDPDARDALPKTFSPKSTVLFYCGPRITKFAETFKSIGHVIIPASAVVVPE